MGCAGCGSDPPPSCLKVGTGTKTVVGRHAHNAARMKQMHSGNALNDQTVNDATWPTHAEHT